jgi:hypothetical protein
MLAVCRGYRAVTVVDGSSSLVAKLAAADADKDRKIRYEVQVRRRRCIASSQHHLTAPYPVAKHGDCTLHNVQHCPHRGIDAARAAAHALLRAPACTAQGASMHCSGRQHALLRAPACTAVHWEEAAKRNV